MTTPTQLADLDLFEGLDTGQLAPLAALAEEVTFDEGTNIFTEGGRATRLFVLVDGKVNIQVALSSRPEHLTVASLTRPGQLVGWSGSLSADTYTASAVCTANSRLLAFDGKAFMTVLEDNPATGFIILRRIADVISGRLRNIQRVILKTM